MSHGWARHSYPGAGGSGRRAQATTATDYYAHACVARAPLCTCRSELSDDCMTSCAALWHAYVSDGLYAAPVMWEVWQNDSLAVTPT